MCVAISTKAQIVQYVTLTENSVSYAVQTNQIISVVGYNWADIGNSAQTYVFGNSPDGTSINLAPFTSLQNPATFSIGTAFPQIPQIVTGLTNLVILHGWATFKIETPCTANVISNYVPADAIVIPTSAAGNVQIILESSADLVNWTAANPGTYSAASATNRFFRVRAALTP